MILFDDIGSFPLPADISKEEVGRIAGSRDPEAIKKLFPVMNQVFDMKCRAGVQIPNYAQFQDMNEQFLGVIRDEKCCEEGRPFTLKYECAGTAELEALEIYAAEKRLETGEKTDVRMCVTGPTELFLAEFGSASYDDIYRRFAEDINLFVRKGIRESRNIRIRTISVDEPSIGINPDLSLSRDTLIDGLTTASRAAAKCGCDVEIHIHSPLYYDIACETPTINVIGMESAATPSYVDMIDKTVLEKTDTFVRAGISRTDIFSMAGALSEKYGFNVWSRPELLNEVVTELETSAIIEMRLEKLYGHFGDLIRYAGPDCGLGSWPSQETAAALLRNTGDAVRRFNEKHKPEF